MPMCRIKVEASIEVPVSQCEEEGGMERTRSRLTTGHDTKQQILIPDWRRTKAIHRHELESADRRQKDSGN